MKNVFFKGIFLLMIHNTLSAQQYGSFEDSRDGRVYKTVKIGTQIWMAENLNASSFLNGDSIPQAETDSLWRKISVSEKKSAWCIRQSFAKKAGITFGSFGKLYNWYAVNDPRGLAPKGWHIPNDEEWAELIKYLGGEENAGTKMKSTHNWTPKFSGTNESGFSAMPSGYKYWWEEVSTYYFGEKGPMCFFWSSTLLLNKDESLAEDANFFRISDHTMAGLHHYTITKALGFSVRCIKN
jgi:uncharacterized protein (TIGR02145 family)